MTDVDGLVERDDLAARLTGRAAWYREAHPRAVKTPELLDRAAAALRQLQSDRDELRKALEPFARVFAEKMRDYPDGSAKSEPPDEQHAWGFNSVDLTWGDFRTARRLIERETR